MIRVNGKRKPYPIRHAGGGARGARCESQADRRGLLSPPRDEGAASAAAQARRQLGQKRWELRPERDFLVHTFQPTAEARGWDVVVLNDGTRADVAIKRPEWETYLGIQVKTTQTVTSGRKRTYHFKDTKGYTGLLVVCWVVERAYGWAFDGEWLDGRTSDNLKVTPVPKCLR